jgi:hypothetical protein
MVYHPLKEKIRRNFLDPRLFTTSNKTVIAKHLLEEEVTVPCGHANITL